MKTKILGAFAVAMLIAPSAVAAQQNYEETLKEAYFEIRGGASSFGVADNTGAHIARGFLLRASSTRAS